MTSSSSNLSNRVSICLNMIVKNESRIITRLLESVLPIIDTYLICDTGSTDGTPDIIHDFFSSRGIKGEVIHEPFKNFGYNRTYALQNAHGKATYALLLDADMIFKIEPSFDKHSLVADSYLIIQKNGSLTYYNTRLIRLDINVKCVGPTHEYYDLPPGSRSEKLDTLWIDDIGDGGSKADKFERDIRLLKEGIREEPNNARYYFYLANSYFNIGRTAESIPYYKRRIELGGWCEEVFYSHLNLGHAYKSLKEDEMAIFTWMAGYNVHPARAETIYEITKYYREKGKHKIGMVFALLGKQISYPKNDTLFIHNDVYETGFDYELSILGYYNKIPDIHKIIHRLMNKIKMPHRWNNLLSNYKFSCPKIESYLVKKVGGISIKEKITVCGIEYEMTGSNPCIFKDDDKYMLNIRMVNYHLNYNGSYHFPVDNNKIVTVNQIWKLDSNSLERIETPITLVPDNDLLRYVGIEDWKPYPLSVSNTWPYLGSIQSPRTGNISVGFGIYKPNMNCDILSYKVVETKWNKECEKNWVFFGSEEYNVIYQWFPLTIGKIVDKNDDKYLEVLEEKPMPDFFRHVRGSTHGYEDENEIWFLAHVVEYSQPREYYHLFVVFDKLENGDIKLNRWSHLFKFEGEKIEFALGLIVEKDKNRIIVSYSKWDREPVIAIYDKLKVENEMFLEIF